MCRLTCIMVRFAYPLYFIGPFLLLLGFISTGLAQTSYQYDFNADCRKAYDEIISLRLYSGKQILEIEKKKTTNQSHSIFS